MNREMMAIKAGSNMNSFLGGLFPQACIVCSLQGDGAIVHRHCEQGFSRVFVQGDEEIKLRPGNKKQRKSILPYWIYLSFTSYLTF